MLTTKNHIELMLDNTSLLYYVEVLHFTAHKALLFKHLICLTSTQ